MRSRFATTEHFKGPVTVNRDNEVWKYRWRDWCWYYYMLNPQLSRALQIMISEYKIILKPMLAFQDKFRQCTRYILSIPWGRKNRSEHWEPPTLIPIFFPYLFTKHENFLVLWFFLVSLFLYHIWCILHCGLFWLCLNNIMAITVKNHKK